MLAHSLQQVAACKGRRPPFAHVLRPSRLIERRMSDMLEKLFAEYEEYRKRDKHPLPWDIWLKHKKKVRIKNDEA